ncbi:MAG: hypothetical protein KDD77_05525 [Caldilineaceae bacterium]|nr:hypothetical protein [Caldilineaceae bacterium]
MDTPPPANDEQPAESDYNRRRRELVELESECRASDEDLAEAIAERERIERSFAAEIERLAGIEANAIERRARARQRLADRLAQTTGATVTWQA